MVKRYVCGWSSAWMGALVILAATSAWAQEAPAIPAPVIDSGDTAWMLVSTALVLFMTIPGLALFYGGLVRAKNVLSVLMQCFAITALVTVLWAVYGYSLAFDSAGMSEGVLNLHSIIGGLGKFLSRAVTPQSTVLTIPESVFYCYQLTFAIITPALIVGAFAERMKFSAMLWLMALWSTLVYLPVAHMVWGGPGSLMGNLMGVLDFAGGTVVHINAGFSALVCALMLGKRKGYRIEPMPPHNLAMTVTGAAMLWVGWFGFNAGSALAANAQAGMAMLVTHLATAVAALTWMFLEWTLHGKPSVLGIVTGAVAGLVAITPASGFVGPAGALIIGAASGAICFWSATSLKNRLGYDDSLDAFGVHGVGGTVGALLTGIVASSAFGGSIANLNIPHQFLMQLLGAVITIAYSVAVTFVLLVIIEKFVGLRVPEEEERIGLDLTQHGENSYND